MLYVDNNPKAQRLLTLALEWTGYKVVTADNSDALKRMKQTSPDLMLLAYRMPGMAGSTLIREIEQISPAIPIILVSSHALPSA